MTAELQTRAERNKRAAPKKIKTCSTLPRIDASGRFCPEPGKPYSAYTHFRMHDAEFFHRNESVERAGRCPHCFVDFLGDQGFFQRVHDNTHFCNFEFDGPTGEHCKNGCELLSVLWALGLPRLDPINDFNDGGRA